MSATIDSINSQILVLRTANEEGSVTNEMVADLLRNIIDFLSENSNEGDAILSERIDSSIANWVGAISEEIENREYSDTELSEQIETLSHSLIISPPCFDMASISGSRDALTITFGRSNANCMGSEPVELELPAVQIPMVANSHIGGKAGLMTVEQAQKLASLPTREEFENIVVDQGGLVPMTDDDVNQAIENEFNDNPNNLTI